MSVWEIVIYNLSKVMIAAGLAVSLREILDGYMAREREKLRVLLAGQRHKH